MRREEVNPQAGRDCAADVYKQAGITDPRKDLDCAEVYVPFSWYEPMWLENLGFAAEGEGNLISVVYFKPANHLVTGADPAAENQYIWYPNIFLMPEIGSSVRLLFSRTELEQAPPQLGEKSTATAE